MLLTCQCRHMLLNFIMKMPNLRSFITLGITLKLSLYVAQIRIYKFIYTNLHHSTFCSNVLNIYVEMITEPNIKVNAQLSIIVLVN